MKRTAIIILCLVSAAWLCRYVLTYGEAKWLRIETRPIALPDRPLDIRVTLRTEATGYLDVDLHWQDDKKNYRGYLSGGGKAVILSGKSVYEFSVPVPLHANLSDVILVAFISPDGTWRKRILAATGGPVEVTMTSREPSRSWKSLRAHDIDVPATAAESVTLRFIIAAVWLGVCLATVAGGVHPHRTRLAAGALAASAWELSGAGGLLSGLFRDMAMFSGQYAERRLPQQVVTVLVIVAAVSLLFYLFRLIRRGKGIGAAVFMAAYWTVEILSVFSLHEADMMLSGSAAGLNLGQAIGLLCASLCLGVVVFMNLRGRIAGQEEKFR